MIMSLLVSFAFVTGVPIMLEMLKGNFGFLLVTGVELWYKFGAGDVAGDNLDSSDCCLHPTEHGAEDGPLNLSL